MGDYATLKAGITANIKQNDSQLITGAVLQGQLLAMVNELGAGYQFMGVATPETNPGTPDENVFYIASEVGTYTNFGNAVLNGNEIAVLKWNGSWSKSVIYDFYQSYLGDRIINSVPGGTGYMSLSGLTAGKKYIVKFTLSGEVANANVTLNNTAVGTDVSQTIYTGMMAQGTTYVEITYNGEPLLLYRPTSSLASVTKIEVYGDLMQDISALSAQVSALSVQLASAMTRIEENEDGLERIVESLRISDPLYSISPSGAGYFSIAGIPDGESYILLVNASSDIDGVTITVNQTASAGAVTQTIFSGSLSSGENWFRFKKNTETSIRIAPSGIISSIALCSIYSSVQSVVSNMVGGNVQKLDNGCLHVVPNKKFHFGVRFRMDGINANENGEPIVIANAAGGVSLTDRLVQVVRSKPTLLFSAQPATHYPGGSVTIDPTYRQQPAFLSGIQVINTLLTRDAKDYKPLVGDAAFWIWFKGNFEQSTAPLAADLSQRSSDLQQIQDYAITIEEDTFSIIRDGIDSEGNVFNGGTTSVIYSTSLKSGGTYKTLGALFDEVSQALPDFAFKMNDLSSRKNCGDLLQFGKIKLVGRYYQQFEQNSADFAYRYDSFPVPIYLANDESIHYLEVMYDGSYLYMQMDGAPFSKVSITSNCVKEVYIGSQDGQTNNGITVVDWEYKDDPSGVKIANNTLFSGFTPIIAGLEAHTTEEIYEGETPSIYYNLSTSRSCDVANLIRSRGYRMLSGKELAEVVSGNWRGEQRMSFILRTLEPDGVIGNYAQKVREILDRKGIKYILGSVIEHEIAEHGSQAFKDEVFSAMANGIDVITHSLTQDTVLPEKNSLLNQFEIFKNIDYCKQYGMLLPVYSWAPGCRDENIYTMLAMNGYSCAIGNLARYTAPCYNPYQVGRQDVADRTAWSTIEAYLVK